MMGAATEKARLPTLLEPDEMHLMSILINGVTLKARVGKYLGQHIKT